MIPSIILTNKEQELGHLVVIVSKLSKLPAGIFSTAEKTYLKEQVETLKQEVVSFNRLSYLVFVYFIREEKDLPKRLEMSRKAGDKIAGLLNAQKAIRVARTGRRWMPSPCGRPKSRQCIKRAAPSRNRSPR